LKTKRQAFNKTRKEASSCYCWFDIGQLYESRMTMKGYGQNKVNEKGRGSNPQP
jgi:hypothetical protein